MTARWVRQAIVRAGTDAVVQSFFTWTMTSTVPITAILVAARRWSALSYLRWPVGVASVAACGLLILWWRHRTPSIYRYDYRPVSFRYEVLSCTITYRIDADGLLRYSRALRVRALQGGLDEFVDKYWWSGGDVGAPRPRGSAVRVDEIDDRVGTWRYFRVYFGRTLSKGDEIEFELVWPPIRDWMTSRPFASISTNDPTHYFRFCLQIPPSALNERRAITEILWSSDSLSPFGSSEDSFDENGRFAWEVHRPLLYRYYRVRWFWSAPVLDAANGPPVIPGQVVRTDERTISS